MKQYRDYFLFSVITAIMGQIYFFPFEMEFKFSLAVIILPIILFLFERMNPVILSILSGIMIVALRSFAHIFTNNFAEIILLEGPAFFYYVIFGILFYILNMREKVEESIFNLVFLVVIDSTGNIFEVIIRGNITSEFDRILLAIFLVASLRAVVVSIFVYYIKRSQLKNQKERFRELIFLNAGLNSELFYLKKSGTDLEKMMKLSYEMYEDMNESKNKERALKLAKNIHEIKKDYRRVIEGINYNIDKTSEYRLSFKELIDIVVHNSDKIIYNSKKQIQLHVRLKEDFYIDEYYSLLIIINNLIINSIEAIEESGHVYINQFSEEENIYIQVKDSGAGIHQEDLKVIFKPGFTTKYDKATGKMSSGIGLNHVKDIVENIFKGSIEVESEVEAYTVFTITIPRMYLEGK